jgi:FPC/CPF motif-containing protein YcgG
MSSHPCIGARSLAADKRMFYYAVYPDMRTVESAVLLLDDIEQYYELTDGGDPILKSLLCIFTEDVENSQHFASLFWAFLQTVHDVDSLTHEYDPTVSSDPSAPTFELSFRGRAAFPTTLNPAGRRDARKYAYPGWALNQSAQFNELRAQGAFEDWQRKIRALDAKFDRSEVSNPLLVDHGQGSPGAQLGGVRMDNYPFVARTVEDRPQVANALVAKAVSEGASPDIIERLSALAAQLQMPKDPPARPSAQAPL